MPADLRALIAEELAQPVDPRVTALAAEIAAQHGPAARAVLFYGSCLRTAELDGQMLDFYLIVADYRAAYRKRWLATANHLIPPNVFPFASGGLSAKYAVLSEADFHRLCGPEADTVSVWARFAQPARLVWAADERIRASARDAVIEAMTTLFRMTMPTITGQFTPSQIWRDGFALTYSAELRAERGERPGALVDYDPDRYACLTQPVLAEIARRAGVGPNGEVPLYAPPDRMRRRWRALGRRGKLLTALRLAKASLTFAGGIDYLAWKINRHAGTQIRITPWQRRMPLLAAIILLPRLLRKGAVR